MAAISPPESRERHEPSFERAWHDLQSELAELSTDSTHVVVEGAGHSTLQTDQKDAQVTSAAITKVVEAVRTDQPLTR